jgi:molecular chaperone DnaK (HSP70)
VRETLTRAMENAAVKAGMRRSDVTRVLVTGGTSLIPVVRRHLEAEFGSLIEYDHPFDSVARGACRGIVFPALQHDYAIESFNPERKQYEFKPLFRIGTEYPTPRADAVRKWIGGNHSGQTRIGLKVFEVSQVKRRNLEVSIVDAQGALCDTSKVATDCQYVCLNPDNPTFIPVDPPFDKERDRQRFAASFSVDGNRRLLVTATDHLTGKDVLRDHPVVRL